MTALQRLIPAPHLLEVHRIDVAAPALDVWDEVRLGELSQPVAIRALFKLRTLASRKNGRTAGPLRFDGMRSSPENPGFQVLSEEPLREVAVGAIGKVWQIDIPFVHVADEQAYAAYSEPGYIKVAWAIRVLPRGSESSHVEIELRVSATDEQSWRRFRRYFRVIGPFSRFIRRSLLRTISRRATAGGAGLRGRAA
jgi:hypothetical protein